MKWQFYHMVLYSYPLFVPSLLIYHLQMFDTRNRSASQDLLHYGLFFYYLLFFSFFLFLSLSLSVLLCVIVTIQILFCSKCECLLYTTLPDVIRIPDNNCLQAGGLNTHISIPGRCKMFFFSTILCPI